MAAAAAVVLGACSNNADLADLDRSDVEWGAMVTTADVMRRVTWSDDVQPILEKRCVVCHGCFDAPCQLKLSSFEGLERGANSAKVYDGARIRAAQPSRLEIDASSADEWRDKGFHSVLGVPVASMSAEQRLRESVLYRILRLKQLNPQPRVGRLPLAYTLELDREQACADQLNIARFERDNPLWGMPYAMPNLSDAEYATLVQWLAAGAEGPAPVAEPAELLRLVAEWESFLNGSGKREQLMSRYLYEHLFLGHLHFDTGPARAFYRLVRSYTPPGEPVREIATVRPFDPPGATFWYRLRRYDATIVGKSHVPYQLSAAKMARYRELFLETEYEVDVLPGYALPDAANPFVTFAAIPAASRYKFMLDDARFYIQGFMKGPVCRGQVALNVIEDQFWVTFVDPDAKIDEDDSILKGSASYLQIPSSTQSFNLIATYTRFWEGQKAYLALRSKFLAKEFPQTQAGALQLIWDGDGSNPNAALTVFRNFDSASVEYGFRGDYPETAWIIDYPLLERIHYLLVAAFDVYGNVGHQLNTRLFMDFLRMEGEDNFLLFLPQADRKSIRDNWYRGLRSRRQLFFAEQIDWLGVESPIRYESEAPQREFYGLLEARLGDMAGSPDYLNRCTEQCEPETDNERIAQADAVMRELAKLRGKQLSAFPDVAMLRVLTEDGNDFAYSLMKNKMYFSLSSIFSDGRDVQRDADKDTLSVLHGFSDVYPNFFFVVPVESLQEFVAAARGPDPEAAFAALVGRFGVRRTNPAFWKHADWFQERYAVEQPVEAGLLDLNRYQNL